MVQVRKRWPGGFEGTDCAGNAFGSRGRELSQMSPAAMGWPGPARLHDWRRQSAFGPAVLPASADFYLFVCAFGVRTSSLTPRLLAGPPYRRTRLLF